MAYYRVVKSDVNGANPYEMGEICASDAVKAYDKALRIFEKDDDKVLTVTQIRRPRDRTKKHFRSKTGNKVRASCQTAVESAIKNPIITTDICNVTCNKCRELYRDGEV